MKIFDTCMNFTLWHSNNICLYLPKLPPKCKQFWSLDNPCSQRTTSTDACTALCSNTRHKVRPTRTWPKLLLISLSVDHSCFMGLLLNNWKIRDLFNSGSNVYRSMIQPKSIHAGLQDSFIFPLYLNLSFSIFSSRHLKRPWCSWWPCNLATARKWLCFLNHQTNKLLHLLENRFGVSFGWLVGWLFFNSGL